MNSQQAQAEKNVLAALESPLKSVDLKISRAISKEESYRLQQLHTNALVKVRSALARTEGVAPAKYKVKITQPYIGCVRVSLIAPLQLETAEVSNG